MTNKESRRKNKASVDAERKTSDETIETAVLALARRTLPGTELEARITHHPTRVDVFRYMRIVEVVIDPLREISIREAKKIEPEASIGEDFGFEVLYRNKSKASMQAKRYAFLRTPELVELKKGISRILERA